MEQTSFLIKRKDRWADILEKLRLGGDRDVEFPPTLRKRSKDIFILGRSMTIAEASDLSGLAPSFFKQYQGREIPVEDIILQLDKKWIKDKTKFLKQGLS